MQKGNPEDIKDENVKSDLEIDPDSGCTPTAAKLLCIDTAQQIQDSEEGGPNTLQMLNLYSHLMKSPENTSKRLVVISDVLNYKDEANLKFSNNRPITSDQLRREMIILEPSTYQNKASLNVAITSTNLLMARSWSSRRVDNEKEGTEVNRSWYYIHQKTMPRIAFVAYYSAPNSTTQSSFVISVGFKK